MPTQLIIALVAVVIVVVIPIALGARRRARERVERTTPPPSDPPLVESAGPAGPMTASTAWMPPTAPPGTSQAAPEAAGSDAPAEAEPAPPGPAGETGWRPPDLFSAPPSHDAPAVAEEWLPPDPPPVITGAEAGSAADDHPPAPAWEPLPEPDAGWTREPEPAAEEPAYDPARRPWDQALSEWALPVTLPPPAPVAPPVAAGYDPSRPPWEQEQPAAAPDAPSPAPEPEPDAWAAEPAFQAPPQTEGSEPDWRPDADEAAWDAAPKAATPEPEPAESDWAPQPPSAAAEAAAPVLRATSLAVESGPDAGTWREIQDAAVQVGRAPGNDLVFRDQATSGSHARFERRGDALHVVDLGSTNGTLVNGEPVQEREVHPGDLVTVGANQIRIG